jgi:long-chain acyl-CoA synthetase
MVDGWLHTGDIGLLDEDGYLKITDRKKDIIVNSGGDNISPQRVEGMLTVEPEIGQAMVYGDKRPHLVGLIVPDSDFATAWAKQQQRGAELGTLIQDEDFVSAIDKAIVRVNQRLTAPERVRRFILAAEPFTIDNGMLTPSLKIRRHIIKAEYGQRLDALYRG